MKGAREPFVRCEQLASFALGQAHVQAVMHADPKLRCQGKGSL